LRARGGLAQGRRTSTANACHPAGASRAAKTATSCCPPPLLDCCAPGGSQHDHRAGYFPDRAVQPSYTTRQLQTVPAIPAATLRHQHVSPCTRCGTARHASARPNTISVIQVLLKTATYCPLTSGSKDDLLSVSTRGAGDRADCQAAPNPRRRARGCFCTRQLARLHTGGGCAQAAFNTR